MYPASMCRCAGAVFLLLIMFLQINEVRAALAGFFDDILKPMDDLEKTIDQFPGSHDDDEDIHFPYINATTRVPKQRNHSTTSTTRTTRTTRTVISFTTALSDIDKRDHDDGQTSTSGLPLCGTEDGIDPNIRALPDGRIIKRFPGMNMGDIRAAVDSFQELNPIPDSVKFRERCIRNHKRCLRRCTRPTEDYSILDPDEPEDLPMDKDKSSSGTGLDIEKYRLFVKHLCNIIGCENSMGQPVPRCDNCNMHRPARAARPQIEDRRPVDRCTAECRVKFNDCLRKSVCQQQMKECRDKCGGGKLPKECDLPNVVCQYRCIDQSRSCANSRTLGRRL